MLVSEVCYIVEYFAGRNHRKDVLAILAKYNYNLTVFQECPIITNDTLVELCINFGIVSWVKIIQKMTYDINPNLYPHVTVPMENGLYILDNVWMPNINRAKYCYMVQRPTAEELVFIQKKYNMPLGYYGAIPSSVSIGTSPTPSVNFLESYAFNHLDELLLIRGFNDYLSTKPYLILNLKCYIIAEIYNQYYNYLNKVDI